MIAQTTIESSTMRVQFPCRGFFHLSEKTSHSPSFGKSPSSVMLHRPASPLAERSHGGLKDESMMPDTEDIVVSPVC